MLNSNIKKYMIINRLTSKELAKLTDVSPVHISYILNNRRKPSIELIDKIAKALNVSVEQLFEEHSGESLKDDAESIKKQNQIVTVAAHLQEMDLTPEKLKLLNEYIDILFKKTC